MSNAVLVIPCYNEADRLELPAFHSFLEENPDFRFVMIDDGSTDATAAVLAPLSERWGERCRVLSFEQNVGKAEAVRTGLLECRGFDCQFVGFFDADLATPLDAVLEMRTLLESQEALALVMGARVQLLGRRIDRKASRHYSGRIFATAASLSLGIPVYDTQCGAKLFRASQELWSVLGEPFHSRWIFDVELLARMILYRRQQSLPGLEEAVFEHDLDEWTDVVGSKLSLSDFVRAIPELWRIRRTLQIEDVPLPR